MSELENNTSLAEDDEISLIDLFSVIIRHRMMIIIGSAAVFVLAVLYLFILPIVFPKIMVRESTVEYSIDVTPVPGVIAGEVPPRFSSLKTVLTTEFTDVVFLVKELSKNNPFVTGDGKELTEFEFNQFVQDLQKKKKIIVYQAPVRDEVIIKMEIPKENLDVASRLVDSMVSSVNNAVETPFLREIAKIKKTKLETYNEITSTFSENSNITDAQILMLSVRQIDEFMSTYKGISERTLEPFVILEPTGRVKKTIIATFAAFFVFVFIAFLKNAIENIKKDPEASGKIKNAWDEGKLGRK